MSDTLNPSPGRHAERKEKGARTSPSAAAIRSRESKARRKVGHAVWHGLDAEREGRLPDGDMVGVLAVVLAVRDRKSVVRERVSTIV